jgi:hypothetical protein
MFCGFFLIKEFHKKQIEQMAIVIEFETGDKNQIHISYKITTYNVKQLEFYCLFLYVSKDTFEFRWYTETEKVSLILLKRN